LLNYLALNESFSNRIYSRVFSSVLAVFTKL
jgi:hypothetical protein